MRSRGRIIRLRAALRIDMSAKGRLANVVRAQQRDRFRIL